ncbi:hypothetical protein yinte0001_24240 [Yersinia intermedia ATCC 29909]|nr:hypothetical protein yinte0001_24240 [Yersinia intermedia ATCC 29909]
MLITLIHYPHSPSITVKKTGNDTGKLGCKTRNNPVSTPIQMKKNRLKEAV